MSRIVWDTIGDRVYETGVDHGVLYLPDNQGVYADGVPWSGLVTVTESPSGAEATAQYADNLKYLNLYSAEDFAATIEAFTWPDEFSRFDGSAQPTPGVLIGQQNRPAFGLSYRTLKGNDLAGNDYGYKLHLLYGCKASPSEKAYGTINDTPSPITFSWSVSTTPVPVPDHKPSASIIIDSTLVDPGRLAALEQVLYGATGVDPSLPLPATIITMLSDDSTIVSPSVPTYNGTTHVLTIPTVAGVSYLINGEVVPPGTVTLTEDVIVVARPNAGYIFAPDVDDDWAYNY